MWVLKFDFSAKGFQYNKSEVEVGVQVRVGVQPLFLLMDGWVVQKNKQNYCYSQLNEDEFGVQLGDFFGVNECKGCKEGSLSCHCHHFQSEPPLSVRLLSVQIVILIIGILQSIIYYKYLKLIIYWQNNYKPFNLNYIAPQPRGAKNIFLSVILV